MLEILRLPSSVYQVFVCYLLNNWTNYPAKFVEQLVYSTVKFQYPNDLGCKSKVSFGLPICLQYYHLANGLFVCFVALRPKSTAMVMAGRPVPITTLFPGQALTSSWPVLCAHTFACNWQQSFLNNSAEGRRITVEIISWSTSTKVQDRVGIESRDPWICIQTHICCQTRYRLRKRSYWIQPNLFSYLLTQVGEQEHYCFFVFWIPLAWAPVSVHFLALLSLSELLGRRQPNLWAT